MTSKLSVYRIEVDQSWTIASSPAEAVALCEKMMGSTFEEMGVLEDLDEDDVLAEPEEDDKHLTITDDDGVNEKRTCAEWVALKGPGYLCGENW